MVVFKCVVSNVYILIVLDSIYYSVCAGTLFSRTFDVDQCVCLSKVIITTTYPHSKAIIIHLFTYNLIVFYISKEHKKNKLPKMIKLHYFCIFIKANLDCPILISPGRSHCRF